MGSLLIFLIFGFLFLFFTLMQFLELMFDILKRNRDEQVKDIAFLRRQTENAFLSSFMGMIVILSGIAAIFSTRIEITCGKCQSQVISWNTKDENK